MLKFLRRVFILLVLFVIIFLIFRFAKPEATSRFVDKVKAIPTTISSRFHREKNSNIIINGSTTSTKSDFEGENDSNYEDEYNQESVDDSSYEIDSENDWYADNLLRLEELNKELDKIKNSGNDEELIISDETDNENLNEWDTVQQTAEIDKNDAENWDLGEIISDILDNWDDSQQTEISSQSTTQTTNTKTNTKTNTSSNKQKRWDCGSWLTVQDCEDLARDFWNYN